MCSQPITMIQEEHGTKTVPCGKCELCRARHVSGWTFRILEEMKDAESAHFVTMTYADHELPKIEYYFNDQDYWLLDNLDKSDVQKFFKRLRKYQEKTKLPKIRYYLTGEYGSETERPHYHAIIFNSSEELIIKAWSKFHLDTQQREPIGHVHFGKVTEASVRYTLAYMNKPRIIPVDEYDTRQPEFSLMSKGLGKRYLTDQMKNWHTSGKRKYVQLPGGQKASMPRYYQEKIFSDQDKELMKLKSQITQASKSVEEVIDDGTILYRKRDYRELRNSKRKQKL